MAQADHQSSLNLPESLRTKFTDLERRLWKVETARAISISLVALSASYLVLFFADRFWNSPVWFRSLSFLAGLAVLVFAAFRWIKNWVLKRRDLRALANLVQDKFRRLGDRLLGIVELSAEQQHASNFSPELYRAAINQVATEAEKFDFREAVDVRSTRKIIIAAASSAIILLLFGVLFPVVSLNVLHRWLAPIAQIPRETLVGIEKLPGNWLFRMAKIFP